MEQKVKVLMVGPDRGVHGGISAVVNELYNAGLDKEVEINYIGTMKEGSKAKKFGVAVVSYIQFLSKLSKYDIVHVHFSSDSSFYRKSHFIRAAYRKNKKIVLHQHGGDFKTFYDKELDDKAKKRVRDTLDMGDVMLVLTQSWKDFFSKLTDPGKLTVFPNGIKVSGAQEKDNSAKNYNDILFLGRVCKDKGIDELLLAMDEIHSINVDAHLYIGGIYEEPEYRDKIEKRKSYITYLGWVTGEEKEKYLRKCGILVLPSYYEGFPVSIIEALSNESAVVACAVGGIPEIIDNHVNGILIPPKDEKALREALEDIMGDKEKARKYGLEGRKKVIENFSVEENIKKLVEIYKGLIG